MQYFERLKLVRERLERRDQRVLVHEMDQACPPSLGLRRMVKDTCGQKVGVVWWGWMPSGGGRAGYVSNRLFLTLLASE